MSPFMVVVTLILVLGQTPTVARAQPAPTFRAACGELRQALRDHRIDGEELVTIEVVGTLTIVRSDGALVYMGVCQPPDPEVLCVTYQTGGRKAGERAVVTGAYIPRGPDHIQLDPCLHHDPE